MSATGPVPTPRVSPEPGAGRLGVFSEVGRLRDVLVHRPGAELVAMSPHTMREWLFEDLPWLDGAQAEHDRLCGLLRSRGVTVHTLVDLLITVLADRRARADVLRSLRPGRDLGAAPHQLSATLIDLVVDGDPEQLARCLIGDRDPAGDGLGDVPGLAPLPNLLFQRDASTWIHSRVRIHRLASTVRAREASILELVYRYHPMFGGAGDALLARPERGAVEGGDLLMTGHGTVVCGVSERSSAEGVEALARDLFVAGEIGQVLAVVLPRSRATMHLDTVLTMVDRDAFLLSPQLPERMRAYLLRPAGSSNAASTWSRSRTCSMPSLDPSEPIGSACCGHRSTRGAPSGSSGEQRPTCSRWHRGWWSPTSATR